MKSNTRNNEVLISFGCHLKKLRESKHISQATLGLKIDSYQSTILRIEQGKINPSLCLLKAIADALEIPLNKLLEFESESDKNTCD